VVTRGEVVKKHFKTIGTCAAFMAIMLSLMPCCCAMSHFATSLCGSHKEFPSCCHQADSHSKRGLSACSTSHQCCCDKDSKVQETPSQANVDFPVIDFVITPVSVALANQHDDAVANLILEHSPAPPKCPIYLSCTNLLV